MVDKYSHPEFPFTADDVYLTYGCHGALQTSVAVMASRGENILVAKPSFPLVKAICENLGVEIKFFDLLPDKGWECDLEMMRKLIDHKTKAILVVNPSNPCSVVWRKEHQLEILHVAEDFKVPLICDEVYYGLVFPGQVFHSFGNLTSTVPLLCMNSLSKVFQVPGWRLGWLITYNRHGYLDVVKDHLTKY